MRPYRSKDPRMQAQYDVMMAMANDPTSTLYNSDGSQHTGAGHRSAFWRGFNGTWDNLPNLRPAPGSLLYPCYRAGQDFRNQQ